MFESPDWTGDHFPEEFLDLKSRTHSVLWGCRDLKSFALWRTDGEYATEDLFRVASLASHIYSSLAARVYARACLFRLRETPSQRETLLDLGSYVCLEGFVCRNIDPNYRRVINSAVWTSEYLLDVSGERMLTEEEKYIMECSREHVSYELGVQATIRSALKKARETES